MVNAILLYEISKFVKISSAWQHQGFAWTYINLSSLEVFWQIGKLLKKLIHL